MSLRTAALLAALSLASLEVRAQEAGECTTYWLVRISYWAPGEDPTLPWRVTTQEVGPLTEIRSEAETRRDDIVAHGYVWPAQVSGQQSETRVAPANILFASVKQICCRQVGPPQTWWCVYPDCSPPPSL